MKKATDKNSHSLIKIAKEIFANENTEINIFLLLAEAGMGKTLNMQKIFIALTSLTFQKNRPFVFVYCNIDTDRQIEDVLSKLTLEQQKETVIFIDAIDEDKVIRKAEDRAERFKQLIKKVAHFYRVFVSVRKEHFSMDEIIYQTAGSIPIFTYSVDKIDVKDFISKFIKKNIPKKDQPIAKKIVAGKEHTLYYRPLILNYLRYFVINAQETQKFEYEYETYTYIFKQWTNDQIKKTAKDIQGITQSDKFTTLKQVGQKIALHFFNEDKMGISHSELEKQLGNIQFTDRSFFVRYTGEKLDGVEKDYFVFAHSMFYYFFLTELLFNFEIIELEFYQKETSKEAHQLYKERLFVELFNSKGDFDQIFDTNYLFNTKSELYKTLTKNGIQDKYFLILFHLHKDKLEQHAQKNFFDLINELEKLIQPHQRKHQAFENYEFLNQNKENFENKEFQKRFQENIYFKYITTQYALEELFFAKKSNPIPCSHIISSFQYSLGKMLFFIKTYNEELYSSWKARFFGVDELNLQGLGISEIKTISELFPNLITLNLNNNNFTYNDKKPCPIQEILFFNDNRNRKLETLTLKGNPLTTHDFFKKLFEDNPEEDFNCLEIVRPIAGLTFVKGEVFTQGIPKDYQTKDGQKLDENYSIGDTTFHDAVYPHKVELSDYRIGKYQITVGNFAVFMNDKTENYKTDAEKGTLLWYYDEKQEKYVKDEKKGSAVAEWLPNGKGRILKSVLNEKTRWYHDAEGADESKEGKGVQKDKTCPVIHISWNDAKVYCKWLSEKTGLKINLPSESQWEYAAKGGVKGIDDNFDYAGGNQIDDIAYYWKNRRGENVQPVGEKVQNQLQLYDMSGNAYDWCEDDYERDIYRIRKDIVRKLVRHNFSLVRCKLKKEEKAPYMSKRGIIKNPIYYKFSIVYYELKAKEKAPYSITNKIDSITIKKVLRGGSWINDSAICLVTYRYGVNAANRDDITGFRICSPSIV